MTILYLLIPLGLVLLGVAIWAFMWAVRSGQFDMGAFDDFAFNNIFAELDCFGSKFGKIC